MTQDDYKLWTGDDASRYTPEQWTKLQASAERRLASFLCLSELPTDDQGKLYPDIEELLANFIAAVISHQGGASSTVESKHVRNFTISFKTEIAANAFAQIAGQYGDIIEQYSNCDSAIRVERNAIYHCGRGCGGCGR